MIGVLPLAPEAIMAESTGLPEFEHPPVSEVVLGVQFEPLAQWSVPQFGLYWSEIRAEYPLAEVQPPVMSQVEAFGQRRAKPALEIAFEPADVRCWFLTEARTRLVQVQRDRFMVNWRKVQGDEPYPRYEKDIRPKFLLEYSRFSRHLASLGIESLNVVQCEVTYVNEFERGEGWENFNDLSQLLAPWSGRMTDGFLPGAETAQLNLAYPMPEEQGRLHVAVQHAFRVRDSKEIIQMRLTARGRPAGSSNEEALAWFDAGRAWVVKGFADITAEASQQRWGRKAQ